MNGTLHILDKSVLTEIVNYIHLIHSISSAKSQVQVLLLFQILMAKKCLENAMKSLKGVLAVIRRVLKRPLHVMSVKKDISGTAVVRTADAPNAIGFQIELAWRIALTAMNTSARTARKVSTS